jgi:hypothetical protein
MTPSQTESLLQLQLLERLAVALEKIAVALERQVGPPPVTGVQAWPVWNQPYQPVPVSPTIDPFSPYSPTWTGDPLPGQSTMTCEAK